MQVCFCVCVFMSMHVYLNEKVGMELDWEGPMKCEITELGRWYPIEC